MRELDELGTIIDVLLEQSAKEGEYYKTLLSGLKIFLLKAETLNARLII